MGAAARFRNRDNEGFDNEGFDNEGFDNEGFDNEGFDNEGFDNESGVATVTLYKVLGGRINQKIKN